jgi:bifunctional UDP-N-acetylglucosamine pyrophosphorylase/glucosamine-1-phosphate N-acetyltransferase
MKVSTILLAAGKSTRMKSKTPKFLHALVGKPMILHSIASIKEFTPEKPLIVVGHQAEQLIDLVGDQALFAEQKEQLGTGHAVMQCKEQLEGKSDLVVIIFGDMPLLKGKTISELIECQKKNSGPVSMLTVIADDPRGFGRIIRGSSRTVEAIVEDVDCTQEQKKINELNASMYCFDADWLWTNLEKIPISAKGEYYLTDIIAIAHSQGLPIEAKVIEDPIEAMGINTRVHLAEAEKILRRRINEDLMNAGVTLIDPESTYIEPDVTIGADTIIHPNTHLHGETSIGEDCEVGPSTVIKDSKVGNGCKVLMSVLENAQMDDHSDIGPYGHLRKGAHLGKHVHMGNYGEVKNSYIGENSKLGHFSYIGDAEIGKNVNIGAGTITCNYDGEKKNKTIIEDDVFIGSDTMLIAPLKIGKSAHTGAGSVVNKDVPENTIVVGSPARAIKKLK